MKFRITKAKITAGIVILAVSVVLSVLIIHTLTDGLSRDDGDYNLTETGHTLGEPFGVSVEYLGMDSGRYGISFSGLSLQWGYNADADSGRLFLTGTVENISGRDISGCDLQFSLLNTLGEEIGGGMTWLADIAMGAASDFVCELSPVNAGGYADIRAVRLDWAGV